MRYLIFILAFIILAGSIISCNPAVKPINLNIDSSYDSIMDSLSRANNLKDLESLKDSNQFYTIATKGIEPGSVWDAWIKYFNNCLQTDIDVEKNISFLSTTNIDGPGRLYDSKFGLAGKDLKKILSPETYWQLVDTSGSSTCQGTLQQSKELGGFFKIALLKLLNINPVASGTKYDTIEFHTDHYVKLAINESILDSLYQASESNPQLKAFFDEFNKKNDRLIIKGWRISGFTATLKFTKLDTVGLTAGLDTGLVKNLSGTVGFKFKKSANNSIVASSLNDFIPLVQFARKKDLLNQ